MRIWWLLAVPALGMAQIGEAPGFAENGKFQTGTTASTLDGSAHVSAGRAQIDQSLVNLLRLWPGAETGSRLLASGMLDAADQHFRSTGMRAGIAVTDFLKGKVEASADELIRLAGEYPKDLRVLPLLGETIGVAPGASVRMLKQIRIIAAAHPENEQAHFYLAQALLKQDPPQTGEALEHLETASRLNPGSTRALLESARHYQAAGQEQKAIAALEEVTRRDPALAVAHYRLSQLYLASGDTEKSRAHLRRYQELR